jgi:hypothetical protein
MMWFLPSSMDNGLAEVLSLREWNRGSSSFKRCVAGGHSCCLPEKVFQQLHEHWWKCGTLKNNN